MRKVFRYLIEYQRKHFDLKLYALTGAFLAICILVNYWLDFEDGVVDSYRDTPWLHWLYMFLFQVFPFLVVCFLLYFTGKEKSWISSKPFWIRLIIGFSILALDRIFSGSWVVPESLTWVDYRFISKCVRWSGSLLTAVLPLLLFYLIMERNDYRTYYGLAWKRFDPRPYFIMLGIATVLIGIGSFFSDIQEYYPRYATAYGDRFAERHGFAEWVSVLIYEIAYGSDFVSVELFFRGFLIHGFVRVLGGYAVLPMIAAYAFLHFGKPMTEAISSIFGGYILGIISLYTRNIWGGVIIHMGVAWVMELFGYLQR